MNLMSEWLRQCSNCFNSTSNENSFLTTSDYYINLRNLAKDCQHISDKKEFICETCFLKFFLYDRFIIQQLFIYLKQEQTNFIHIKDFSLFAQRIISWHEFSNHIDFILQLFHIILTRNFQANSINYLIEDAFFFTAIQTNIQTDLTNQSQIFLRNFVDYLHQLNQNTSYKTYFNLIKRIIPFGFVSIHKWLKLCLLSSSNNTYLIRNNLSNELNINLPLTFLWYIINWLVFNKVFPNEYDPMIIFEKISQQEYLTNLYDSDQHGYSIVTLCQSIYNIDGPFLLMFYCQDEKIFGILLEGKLMDSAKPFGGRSSLCLQISPHFLILERGPSFLYWNIKKRSDGPLAIRIGHNGIIRVSLDLNLEYIHHPQGSSRINRVQIYKFGLYKTPIITPIRRQKSQHNEHNLFSVDAHRLAESIGIHLFT